MPGVGMKVPTLFERDWTGDRSRVLDQVHIGCEWVLAGEGVATRKYDGTCVMLDPEGEWWARRDVKEGKEAPPGFLEVELDETTRTRAGWEPMAQAPFAKWHAEAIAGGGPTIAGTYELCGPKVNGNPERYLSHVLIEHVDADLLEIPGRSYDQLALVLKTLDIEGIVFHHEDGRMAKIKKRDFGAKR